MAEQQKKDIAEIYEIKIQGQLDTKWSDWLYGMSITHELDGATTLLGSLPDQMVLHSVLDRIRDMNLPLISVIKMIADGQTTKDEVKGDGHEE